MQCEIKSNHWIVYLCSAWAQGRFSWLTENWKIIFLSRERHWRPLINRIPQEKSCRKDFTPNNSVIADGNIISLLSFTSLYNHVYQNTLNFVQSCKVQYDLVIVMILMIPWFSKPVKVIDKIWMKKNMLNQLMKMQCWHIWEFRNINLFYEFFKIFSNTLLKRNVSANPGKLHLLSQ